MRVASRDRISYCHQFTIAHLATKNDEWHSISGDVLKRLRSQIHEESQKANFWRLLSSEREVEIRLCAFDFFNIVFNWFRFYVCIFLRRLKTAISRLIQHCTNFASSSNQTAFEDLITFSGDNELHLSISSQSFSQQTPLFLNSSHQYASSKLPDSSAPQSLSSSSSIIATSRNASASLSATHRNESRRAHAARPLSLLVSSPPTDASASSASASSSASSRDAFLSALYMPGLLHYLPHLFGRLHALAPVRLLSALAPRFDGEFFVALPTFLIVY